MSRQRRHAIPMAPVCAALICVFGAVAPLSSAADAVFSSAMGRIPNPGEWLEYLVCYPVDPLENSLALSNDALVPLAPDDDALGTPSFEAPVAWRRIPLRLEIRAVENDGLRAEMWFGERRRDIILPLDRQGHERSADGASPAERLSLAIGEEEMEVQVFFGDDAGGRYVRYVNEDLPFGLVRFATEYSDLILVARGAQPTPPFPLPADQTDPPPGALFGRYRDSVRVPIDEPEPVE